MSKNSKKKSDFLFVLILIIIFFMPILFRQMNSHNFANEVLNDSRVENAIVEQTSIVREKIDLNSIPEYSGNPYIEVNGNIPYFEEQDLTTKSYETYGELDSLGRCTTAICCVGQDLMPTEKRESISKVKPTRME